MGLEQPIKITVCADGFVSIMRTATDRRLKAAIPFYSAASLPDAISLIHRVCIMKACEHGGKTGTLIEPWAPNWPLHREASVDDIQELTEIFKRADLPAVWGERNNVEYPNIEECLQLHERLDILYVVDGWMATFYENDGDTEIFVSKSDTMAGLMSMVDSTLGDKIIGARKRK